MAELKATVLKDLPLAKASLQFRVLRHSSLGELRSLESVWSIWTAVAPQRRSSRIKKPRCSPRGASSFKRSGDSHDKSDARNGACGGYAEGRG